MINFLKDVKPCPLCGSKNIYIEDPDVDEQYEIKIGCNDCGLNGCKSFTGDIDVETAIERTINYWNNRPGQRPYTYNYNEDEVKKLAEERNITEAKARYLIYQREYGKEYRKKNKERLSKYHKKWEFANRDHISLLSKERYKKKRRKLHDICI
jgi:hypothetical protein